jgi:hypothetical protein
MAPRPVLRFRHMAQRAIQIGPEVLDGLDAHAQPQQRRRQVLLPGNDGPPFDGRFDRAQAGGVLDEPQTGAMPEAKEIEEPPSRPPTISSSASQPGVPSSREYARRSPRTKFDAGQGGTFSGEPGRRSRPAETSHDSTETGSPALCPVVFSDAMARF